MEQARQQTNGGGDVKRECEPSPTTLKDSCVRRIARVPKVLQSAGKRLRIAAKEVLVKARHPISIRRSPKAKRAREAGAIPAKVKSSLNRILDALTSCVRWRQPEDSDVGLDKS
ncbi:hypothetical protein FA95DRAFT_1558540 [Auriscalpium vulgare]|uniref:Uncharacterized protein n=1 Tax=Auriscalpium vulgare TaxID=40419 RepID=A0ACB8RW29_9AGAM|nr:hypothetical protein FA95DRAFT_1558540 [Auriscalpium vulgare]